MLQQEREPGSAAGPATVRYLAAIPALPVTDEPRAMRFLEAALGLEEVLRDGRSIGIARRGGVEVHVWVTDGRPGAEPHLAGSGSCRIEVRGVEALYERCQRLGVVHPAAPLGDTEFGTREFSILDPDGNLIGVFEWRQDA